MKMNTVKKASNAEVISYYTGYIITSISALMVIPLLTSLYFREWEPVLDFLIGISISSIAGIGMIMLGKRVKVGKSDLQWKHGFIIASLSWILLTFLCAIPYRLSGHNPSLLDSMFDVMSGFTTTGRGTYEGYRPYLERTKYVEAHSYIHRRPGNGSPCSDVPCQGNWRSLQDVCR